ncbi:cation transporter [Legionella taurinensis]|uniref:Cation transporter n=1 Tax=Legionella taurinensis TaxID=70611 RepID=A0A3A5L0T2_9GAMM|nr:cation transporter [Legionella taurinensis]RJT43648.1 cation transporter [Legionella taurinensis]RJT64505.1 cation transporter [Legionella taurinensis]STY25189.1 cation efflux system protein, CDF family [Legionella taurinensis]
MNCECQQATKFADQKVLIIALALNLTMFFVGLTAGIIAQSTGLIADSLDMLADASAYMLSLLAVGRGMRFKTTTAGLSRSLLLILGVGVLIDVGRRALLGSSPISTVIISIACISLVVNSVVLYLLRSFRNGEIHLRATWIFTRADVIANIGVILSGGLIALTKSRYPDLIVGFIISLYVIKEAFQILGEARKTQLTTNNLV